MASISFLDLVRTTAQGDIVGLIEENKRYAPELNVFPSLPPIPGTSYHTVIRTGLPTVSFRNANEGLTPTKSSFKSGLVQCFILGAQIEADKALADASPRGSLMYQAIEASGVMKSAFQKIGSQIWYGTSTDSKGFPGIKAFLAKGSTTDQGDAMVIDATGTTASTASSVYAVKFGEQDVQMVPGNNTTLTLGDWRVQQIVASNGGKMTAYVNSLDGWLGLQIGNQNCARRICNLTADSGKGLTDALLAQLIATFPVGMTPDAIFMSRRSRTQLQISRTVVLYGQGRSRPDQSTVAPTPTEYDGIPIYPTDQILNTDAIE